MRSAGLCAVFRERAVRERAAAEDRRANSRSRRNKPAARIRENDLIWRLPGLALKHVECFELQFNGGRDLGDGLQHSLDKLAEQSRDRKIFASKRRGRSKTIESSGFYDLCLFNTSN